MFEAFFVKNQNSEDLIEAFTNIIPRKLKVRFALHPPFTALLNMPPQAVKFALEEFETGYRMNGGLANAGNKENKQKQISLDSRAREARIWKQKHSVNILMCHACE